nr:MAG TPA: hypothetical protein [Caudoviricetes sp.]
MLDEKDMKAIADLMKIVVENEVTPKFNMLAEMLSDLKGEVDQIPKDDDHKKITDKLEVHDAVLKLHSEEIAELKKAQ